ncbi:MAG: prepilin-type N-terminal cleavage/methylation domain-containing protein [Verrucomicrobiae bacterium]|nr:prepilin-type N-terminal cleavage/methylation domain-containing protein [Verrucomicrobiae bacterium]
MKVITAGGTTRRAFTLIELLVVVAIVVVLAALVWPAYNSARERGRSIACMSSLRQIGMAFRLYAQDYDGYLCPTGTRRNTQTCSLQEGDIHWVQYLAPYYHASRTNTTQLAQSKDRTVFWGCPTFRVYNPGVMETRYGYGMEIYPGKPYSGTWFSNDPYSCIWGNGQWWKLELLTHPRSRILVGDSRDWPMNNPTNSFDDVSKVLQGMRHSGQANYLFVGGHVLSLSATKAAAVLANPTATNLELP